MEAQAIRSSAERTRFSEKEGAYYCNYGVGLFFSFRLSLDGPEEEWEFVTESFMLGRGHIEMVNDHINWLKKV